MHRRITMVLGAVVAVIACGFFAFTTRMNYYDYSPTTCVANSVQIEVAMIGSFSHNPPNVRGAPYYLRLLIKQGGDVGELKSVRLESISSGMDYDESKAIRPSLVHDAFVIKPIVVPYDDYGIFIEMQRVSNPSGPLLFHCTLKKSYSEGFRISWLDGFTSV